MLSLFLLSVATLAVFDVSADQILILGKSESTLWHETRSTYPFSTAGMANLALDSLGLRSGRISSHPAVPSPVQADIFTNSQSYAIILLDETSSSSLNTIHAALSEDQMFNQLYPAQPANVKIPLTVAQKFGSKYPSSTYCAGSIALCASISAETPQVKAEVVQEVLKANSFLSSNDEHDLAFTRELAQLKQLTTNFVQMEGNKLLLVGLTGLQGDKEKAAHEAISNAVLEFLAEMMKFEHVAAAQIMTGSLPTGVEQIAALSRRTRNRKLATKQTTDEETEDAESGNDSEGSDGDDNEEEEIAAASGSMLDDGSNSTSTINSTSQGALLMSDIAEYQIILWTSVLLGATLLMAIMAMVNMNAGRDSLLYANFIADVNGRKTN
ncbi:putative renin receptor [Plasmopara halstedii]